MTSPHAEQAKKLTRPLRDDLAAAGLSIPHSLASPQRSDSAPEQRSG